MVAANFDYLIAEQNQVWLGDCKVSDSTLSFCYGFFAKNTPAKIIVWREDNKGYQIKLPPELTLQPFPINFFKRVQLEILDVAMRKSD